MTFAKDITVDINNMVNYFKVGNQKNYVNGVLTIGGIMLALPDSIKPCKGLAKEAFSFVSWSKMFINP